MGKRERHIDKIARFKERLEKLSTDTLRQRLSFGSLQKEAAIAIRQLLEDRGASVGPSETIYVALLDEGVNVWRPVEAVVLPGGLFRIISVNVAPDTETWQFSTGALVRCEHRTFADGNAGLAAVESPEHAA